MVFLPEGVSDEPFIAGLQKLVHESKQFNLLTAGIRSAYKSNIARRRTEKGVKLSAERTSPGNGNEIGVDPVLFETDVQSFLQNPELAAEVFWPSDTLDPPHEPGRPVGRRIQT